MNMVAFGYSEAIEKLSKDNNLRDFSLGRIVAEHKERYTVQTETGEVDAEVTGNLRYSARSREDYPAIGDWVALIVHDSNFAIIHSIYPRHSVISRQAVGKFGENQIIATNVDYAFIVQSIDRDFNLNRLERYLTICLSSKVTPMVVLTKIDLIPSQKLVEINDSIHQRLANIKTFTISNETREGYEALVQEIKRGKTYCLLGSSGVGKSTLANNLSLEKHMRTGSISESTGKGRHVTSHRELMLIKNGGILIDNPGMREVGVVDVNEGIEHVFDDIIKFANDCKYKDCTHKDEHGCAVLAALDRGDISMAAYENYLKIEKEKSHYETTVLEKKKKDKLFGKILKDYHKKDVKGKNY